MDLTSPRNRAPRIRLVHIAGFWALTVLSGCAGLVLQPVTDGSPHVAGIELSASAPARVLVLHGMGPALDDDYAFQADGIAAGVIDELNLIPVTSVRNSPQDSACELPEDVNLEVRAYRRATSGSDEAEVIFYALNYSRRLQAPEDSYNQTDTLDVGGVGWRRAWANKALRQNLMIDRFGDATAYLRREGRPLRDAVRYAMERMLADADGVGQGYLISHSLGSTIAVDVLGPNGNEVCGATSPEQLHTFQNRFRGYLKSAYLLANQHALVDLHYVPDDDSVSQRDEKSPRPSLQSLLGAPQIVAFSDRNDVLSFVLTEQQCPRNDRCLNALLNTTWLGVPLLYADLIGAHSRYASNATVRRCIAHGCRR